MLVSHTYKFAIDSAEPKTKIQAEQVQWVFRGPQVSCCDDANIFLIKASSGVSNKCPCLLFWILLYVLLWLCIKMIGVVWHRSCNKINLLVYSCYPITWWLPLTNAMLSDSLRWKSSVGSHSRDLGFVPSLNLFLMVGCLTWEQAGPLGEKWRTIGWEGQGVWCGKPAPSRL
jgi:hypothetical protein